MGCPAYTIDSNVTGLAYAKERCLGELPDGTTGVSVIGTFTANTKFLNGNLIWNEQQFQIQVEAEVVADEVLAHARITRIRAGESNLVDIGALFEIGADDPAWDSMDNPIGSIARWSASTGPIANSNVNFLASLKGLVIEDGDAYLVEFDIDPAFGDPASILLTVTDLGQGETVWRSLEPNSYSDFGGEITTVARNPINPSRQRRKGVTTDLEASGEFNHDITQSGLTELMQGFFFANAREKASSNRLSGVSAELVGLTAGNDISFLSGADKYRVGDLVRISGFTLNADTVRAVTVVTDDTAITVDGSGFVLEAALEQSLVEVCGNQSGTGDTALTVVGNKVLLTNSTDDYLLMNLNIGEWIFVGGDTVGSAYDNNIGYARIETITNDVLTLGQPTWASPVDEVGGGVALELYFGTFIRNEKEYSRIVQQTYQLERILGNDGVGAQGEYLTGSVANEFTLNMPTAEKLNADLSFMSLDNELRDGTEGLKIGSRMSPPVEDAYNTSNDIYSTRMYIHSDTEVVPGELFGYASEITVTINNNATANKAISVLGGFSINVGTFEVGGEITAYFTSVSAVKAIRANNDVGFYVIGAKNNAGFVYDIPLLSLGGGRVEVEQDTPIMIPLENFGAENENGYTLSATYFTYLPNAAMPAA